MFAGGVIELLIALLHFVWPIQLVQTGEFARLSTDYKSLLVLNCIAVGLCLTVFGILSLRAAKGLIAAENWAWVYGISQGILWVIRTLFEIVFPVRIPMFFITNPTILVLPLALLLGLLFLVPLVVFRKEVSTI
ncbi:MAG: hypothetical protein HY870_04780 [Chloroflexi bacterium]|nr:hypothetical protein [Chloroflexota bacterium]